MLKAINLLTLYMSKNVVAHSDLIWSLTETVLFLKTMIQHTCGGHWAISAVGPDSLRQVLSSLITLYLSSNFLKFQFLPSTFSQEHRDWRHL